MFEIVNAGSLSDKNSIPLATRCGTPIPNERRMERSPQQLNAAKEYMLKGHPDRELRSLSGTFNCMGHVFACRRTCIEPEHFLKLIAKDDGYRCLDTAENPMPGDVAVYVGKSSQKVEHIGVIINVVPDIMNARFNLRVLSQFGSDGEYFHKDDDLPDALSVGVGILKLTIWTERQLRYAGTN